MCVEVKSFWGVSEHFWQVKKEAESFLRSMAKELAQTPEIRALADDIIASILATWWFQGWGRLFAASKMPL